MDEVLSGCRPEDVEDWKHRPMRLSACGVLSHRALEDAMYDHQQECASRV